MKNLKTFAQLNESSIASHPMAKHVLTDAEINILFDLEEDQIAPGQPGYSDEEFEAFKKDVEGMTVLEYANWRWPDEPQQQFDIVIAALEKKD